VESRLIPLPLRQKLLSVTAGALYTAVLGLALPAALVRLLWRARRDTDYRRRIGERLGRYALPACDDCLWLHAVSVGELIAALPLIEALRAQQPRYQLLVTTTTPAASRLLRRTLGDSVLHVYAPWDLPWIVRRFLDQFRPRALLLMETELWPNQLRACAARDVPVVLLNARLSPRSARGYRRFAALSRAMLGVLEHIAAQGEADAERFIALGAQASRVTVTGSLKWDAQPEASMRQRAAVLRRGWEMAGPRPVWIAASTHHGEEALLFGLMRQLLAEFPQLLMILAPRHAERAAGLLREAREHGLKPMLRTHADDTLDGVNVLVLDTVGELSLLFGCADLAFVGGSLVPHGGHNLAEPAAWGLPLLSGPSLHNFDEMADALKRAAALEVIDRDTLPGALTRLLRQPQERERRGLAALAVVAQRRGARERVLMLLSRIL
jgi:3-deoxy-D-manno-octulosonic-acid transferase